MSIAKIKVHAIFTEQSFVDSRAVEQMLNDANLVYASNDPTLIGVTFGLASSEQDFDPALRIDGQTTKVGVDFEWVREARAIRYPGKLVIFFRSGGGNYSAGWADYVVMAGPDGMTFAHEAGHFFHLVHTHSDIGLISGQKPYPTRLPYIRELIKDAVDSGGYQIGNALDIFDGDKANVSDTPPDPGPPIFQPNDLPEECCTDPTSNPPRPNSISLNVTFGNGTSHRYTIRPDKTNIMSYYLHCPGTHTISPDQRRVIERALVSGNRRHLADGVSPEGPASVVTSNGHIHVFARGDDRNIWYSFWNGTNWSGWRADLGARTLTSGPAAVVTADGHIHVFARGDDRNIWHSFWNETNWSGWRADLGAGTLTSGPAAVVTSSGRTQHIHVFARGDDRNIWHSFWNGTNWSGWRADWAVGLFMSGLAAAVTADNAIHAFAQGDDRNIWHSVWNGRVWSGWNAELGGGTFQP
jgi:hypothetical protein